MARSRPPGCGGGRNCRWSGYSCGAGIRNREWERARVSAGIARSDGRAVILGEADRRAVDVPDPRDQESSLVPLSVFQQYRQPLSHVAIIRIQHADVLTTSDRDTGIQGGMGSPVVLTEESIRMGLLRQQPFGDRGGVV